MGASLDLSLAEWIVLALVTEEPKHGFAVAALTAPAGDVGQVWQVPRPIVYRSVSRLTALELVRIEGTEHGDRGPQRSVLIATAAGRSAVDQWLITPVAHVREVRSVLLVKLALVARMDHDSRGLLTAQRAVFAPMESALLQRQMDETDFKRVLATWRSESVRAALRFLDQVESQ